MYRARNAHSNPAHLNSFFRNPIGAHGHTRTHADAEAKADTLNLGQL